MKKPLISALALAAAFVLPAASPVDSILGVLEHPRAFAARIESTAGLTGSVLESPDGDFIVAYRLPGQEADAFVAEIADSVYRYKRATLSVEPVRPEAFAADGMARFAPKVLASYLRACIASGSATSRVRAVLPDTISVETLHDGVPVAADVFVIDASTGRLRAEIIRAITPGGDVLRHEIIPSDSVPDRITRATLERLYPEAFIPRLPHTFLKTVGTGSQARVDLRDEARNAVVAVLDAFDSATPALMDRVRVLAAGRPIFWAFTDTRIDDITDRCRGPLPAGETALMGARALGFTPPALIEIENQTITSVTDPSECLR